MKRSIILLLGVMISAIGCSDSEDTGIYVEPEVASALDNLYSGASNVKWEKKGFYKVATFNYGSHVHKAWFENDGTWHMTEKRCSFDELPGAVQSSHRSSAFSNQSLVAADHLSRRHIDDIYVISTGPTNSPSEYYYSPEGIHVKTVDDSNRVYTDFRDELVPAISQKAFNYVAQYYDGCRVMEIDVLFPGIIYITVIDNNIPKMLEFSITGAWSMTFWPVERDYVTANYPEVEASLPNDSYRSYQSSLVSLNYCETYAYRYFWYQFDQGGETINIKITPEGMLLPV